MKFDKTTALALGLAGSASANWADWSSSADQVEDKTATTTKPAEISSTTWAEWSTTSSSPADNAKTTTSHDPWADWSSASPSSKPADATKSTTQSSWADWSSASSSKPADVTKSSTHGSWAGWASSSGAADYSKSPSVVTVTETKYDATTTVYHSTVFVGPGDCTKTVFPSTCAGSGPTGPAPGAPENKPADASQPAAADSTPAAESTPAASWGGPAAPADSSKPAAAESTTAAGSWGPGSGSSSSPDATTKKTTAAVSPTETAPARSWDGPSKGGPLDIGISLASIVGTNSEVFTWLGDHSAMPSASAAPTYSGWGDWNPNNATTSGGAKPTGGSGLNGTGPAPGSDSSNVTKPFEPLKDAGCNSASDRSKWCGKYSIDTDYYKEGPDTGKTCSANWVITNTTLNYDGSDRLALAINGQVPGPLLECNWGDTVQVTVTNKMQDNATTIHWHGMIQKGTNDQDGVPGVTECAVSPGETRTYTFKANQYGTGWYHSHVLTQYGDGIRGPMVIHGPATANYDIDAGTVMIDDLFGTPDAPMTVAETNARIAHFGPGGTWNYILNGANTFPDLSKGKHALWNVKPGQKYLFRIINSAAQNAFAVHFDNHKMQVIAADWVPITPYETDFLNIAIGQRYDVIVEMNQPTAGYFLRAIAQTGCPSGGANSGLGKANGIFVYEGADLTLPTSTAGNVSASNFAGCADEPLASLVPHLKKDGGNIVTFQTSAANMPAGLAATVNTDDDGVVFRWFINNGAMNVDLANPTLESIGSHDVSNTTVSNYITLNNKNVWVYFVIQNQFFASHPMHLHGHDMSVLGQGTTAWNPSLVSTLNFINPTRRDTAMLAGAAGPGNPPGYTVIGFQTDNPGVWLMHCHIIWHVDGGLALQYVERPDEIDTGSYLGSSFESECSSLKSYQSANPSHIHSSGFSGLKRRTYFDDLVEGAGVVRRGLEAHKRGRRHGLR